jgi:hypothetical protein
MSYAPINGITLEKFAELSAEVSHTQDPEEQARHLETLGTPRADWEAAKAGWIARMQDIALMGQVATAYMPLYQAAIAKKSGMVDVSFDDYVALTAALQAYGYERMLATYGLDQGAWVQIAGSWNTRMGANMMAYANFHPMCAQEAARLRSGGVHKPVAIQKTSAQAGFSTAVAGAGGVVDPVQPTNAAAQQAIAAQQYQNQMMASAVQANVAASMASANGAAAAAYGQAAQNVGMLGRGMLGAMGLGAIASGIGPGMAVLVQWPDGNKYPGNVTQVGGGQVLVSFANGQQQWVPESSVSKQ